LKTKTLYFYLYMIYTSSSARRCPLKKLDLKKIKFRKISILKQKQNWLACF